MMISLCVSAGRGPVECRDAVAYVLREIAREALARGIAVTSAPGDASGLISLSGEGAEVLASSWTGTIKWTAKSKHRDANRKNWFVAVKRVAMPEVLPRIAPSDVRFETLRAGGPGGQHQNVTESAVRVVHLATGISVVARDERSQHRNRDLAMQRLQAHFAAMNEVAQSDASAKDWRERITVERGNPVRSYVGAGFERVV